MARHVPTFMIIKHTLIEKWFVARCSCLSMGVTVLTASP